jgi:hypothetical protein
MREGAKKSEREESALGHLDDANIRGKVARHVLKSRYLGLLENQ